MFYDEAVVIGISRTFHSSLKHCEKENVQTSSLKDVPRHLNGCSLLNVLDSLLMKCLSRCILSIKLMSFIYMYEVEFKTLYFKR